MYFPPNRCLPGIYEATAGYLPVLGLGVGDAFASLMNRGGQRFEWQHRVVSKVRQDGRYVDEDGVLVWTDSNICERVVTRVVEEV